MVKVSFNREKDSNKISMFVYGHAGQSSMGNDIVCSAASILAYTVAQTIRYIQSQGGLAEEPCIRLDEGDAVITCIPKEEFAGEVLQTYFVAEVGYSLLAHNFPRFVDLKVFGEAE